MRTYARTSTICDLLEIQLIFFVTVTYSANGTIAPWDQQLTVAPVLWPPILLVLRQTLSVLWILLTQFSVVWTGYLCSFPLLDEHMKYLHEQTLQVKYPSKTG